jgi:hypothetical protein
LAASAMVQAYKKIPKRTKYSFAAPSTVYRFVHTFEECCAASAGRPERSQLSYV